jgi:hypothetical protein
MNTLTRPVGARAILSAGACMALAGCGATVASTSGGGVPAATAPGHAASVSAGSGAGSGGGSAASGASIPFPAAVGDTWVYKLSFALGSGSMATDKVVANVPVAGGRQVTMVQTSEGLTTRLIFVFHPDGSITYPVADVGGQTTSPGGILWPPASVIASRQPVRQQVTMHTGAGSQTDLVQTTVQGAGTATVTVPAGTYQATIVNVTMTVPLGGGSITVVEVRTWFAADVGPVKSETLITRGGNTTATARSELTSFIKV